MILTLLFKFGLKLGYAKRRKISASISRCSSNVDETTTMSFRWENTCGDYSGVNNYVVREALKRPWRRVKSERHGLKLHHLPPSGTMKAVCGKLSGVNLACQ